MAICSEVGNDTAFPAIVGEAAGNVVILFTGCKGCIIVVEVKVVDGCNIVVEFGSKAAVAGSDVACHAIIVDDAVVIVTVELNDDDGACDDEDGMFTTNAVDDDAGAMVVSQFDANDVVG